MLMRLIPIRRIGNMLFGGVIMRGFWRLSRELTRGGFFIVGRVLGVSSLVMWMGCFVGSEFLLGSSVRDVELFSISELIR